jgi:hypothetical protein
MIESRDSPKYAPNMKIDPWAKLMTPINPKIRVSPTVINASVSPESIPKTVTPMNSPRLSIELGYIMKINKTIGPYQRLSIL